MDLKKCAVQQNNYCAVQQNPVSFSVNGCCWVPMVCSMLLRNTTTDQVTTLTEGI